MRAFLTAGIPLAKVDALRPLLEAGAERLTFSTHLSSYIPFVLEMEQDLLLEELKDKPYISLIFDGSTYHGEALVIIVRFVQSDYTICQRLVRVRLLSKSVNGQELAHEVITVLSTQLQYPTDRVVAAIRDGTNVNTAAVRFLKDIMYPNVTDIICSPHSLDNVGKRFDTPLLDNFLQSWVMLFAHSPASKLAWLEKTGEAVKSYSSTRWWSWWEMLAQLHRLFHHVQPFLNNLEGCPATRANLLRVFQNSKDFEQLRLQLAITIDTGKVFVMKTYILEGDGELIVEAYSHLQEVATASALEQYPITLDTV